MSYVWCFLLHLQLPQGNWLWLTNNPGEGLHHQEVGAQSVDALFCIIRPAFSFFMSDCIQLKKCPDLWTNGSIALLFCWQGSMCFVVVQQWVLLFVVLGCLLPCANPAWGRQLKGYTWALWMAPITANGTMTRRSGWSYLHTCVHLSSARTLGSRSSERGLPPRYTADCKDHFLKDTKYKQHDHNHLHIPHSYTSRTVIHS